MTLTPPWELATRWLQYVGRAPVLPGYDLTKLMTEASVTGRAAIPLLGFMGFIATGILCHAFRRSRPLTLFAIAGTVGRLATHHQHYDNFMILFLMLALWRQYVNSGHAAVLATFLTVGLSLWLPGRMTDYKPVQIAQLAIWIGGLAIHLCHESRRRDADQPLDAATGDGATRWPTARAT